MARVEEEQGGQRPDQGEVLISHDKVLEFSL